MYRAEFSSFSNTHTSSLCNCFSSKDFAPDIFRKILEHPFLIEGACGYNKGLQIFEIMFSNKPLGKIQFDSNNAPFILC